MRIRCTVAGTAVVLALVASGCARGQPQTATAPHAGGPKVEAPPANSPLAKVQEGMRPEEVQKLVGAPGAIKPYVTGKAFIPWYFGADRTRTAYYYKGQGRVIFSGDGGFGTGSHVLKVEYDPTDPGYPR